MKLTDNQEVFLVLLWADAGGRASDILEAIKMVVDAFDIMV